MVIVYFRTGLANLSGYLSMRVYYKEVTCFKYSRDIISTWDALVCECMSIAIYYVYVALIYALFSATFGGIVGLCLGGSIISIIEFVYSFSFGLIKQIIDPPTSPVRNVIMQVSPYKGGGGFIRRRRTQFAVGNVFNTKVVRRRDVSPQYLE